MRVGNEQLVNPIVFFGGGCLLAAPTTLLRAVLRQRLTLDVAGMRQRHHHIGWRYQVFGAQVKRGVLNLAAARAQLGLTELLPDSGELFADDDGHAARLGQNIQQVINLSHDFFVLGHNFVLLQARQALQAHLQNFLRLGFREAV